MFDVAFVLKTPSALPIVPSVIVEKRSQNFPVVFGEDPNITGGFTGALAYGSGATPTTEQGNAYAGGTTYLMSKINLDASHSSSIYSGTKMQPSALQVLACIRT